MKTGVGTGKGRKSGKGKKTLREYTGKKERKFFRTAKISDGRIFRSKILAKKNKV
jgi:hypothetical protein